MIALLALRPLRRKNFAAITLDRHLIKRNGAWILKFEGDETKTHDRLDVEPQEVVPGEAEAADGWG